jgi:hypothetical protein
MEETQMVSEREVRGGKTLIPGEPMREPSWPVWTLMKGSRIVVLTVLWAGFGMGVGLFCGIFGVLAASVVKHQALDMSLAYRYISIPVAACSGGCAFVWNVFRAMQAAGERRRAKKH